VRAANLFSLIDRVRTLNPDVLNIGATLQQVARPSRRTETRPTRREFA